MEATTVKSTQEGTQSLLEVELVFSVSDGMDT